MAKSDTSARRRIGVAAKASFLTFLRSGAPRTVAAAEAGFPLKSLYGARRRDPLFRLAWTWAMELSAGSEQVDRLARVSTGAEGSYRLAPNGGRIVQRRRMRWVRFTEERRELFLNHFAATADATQAALAAGVCYSTVYKHRRADSAFATRWHEALGMACLALESELLRQRLAAQERAREGIVPSGELAAEFDRTLKLLARWDRRGGRIGQREVGQGRLKRMSFDEAIVLLDKKMRALGLRDGSQT